MKKTSDYIYGPAGFNRHGYLEDAIDKDIITKDEAIKYYQQTSRMMNHRYFDGEFDEEIQFKLDKFFKRNEIDYEDFTNLCKKHSNELFVTVCSLDSFKNGKRCYYNEKGETIEINNFVSRFE